MLSQEFTQDGAIIGSFLRDERLRRKLADPKLDILLMVGYTLNGQDEFTFVSTIRLVHTKDDENNDAYIVEANIEKIGVIPVFVAVIKNGEIEWGDYVPGEWQSILEKAYLGAKVSRRRTLTSGTAA